MYQKNPLALAVHRAIYGVAIAVTAVSVPTTSQAQSEQLEEIVVTGSRIAQDPNLITSSPVTMVRADEITYRGAIRVEDLLNDLPSIVPEFTANE
ncbi:MAG: TonB-dependent receptor, partial [Gammaproteobacteria bacterium]|nr:TonB-dependent receptor [Gammaproteobacteria bacterium]